MMTRFDYFKKTFLGVFVFVFIFKMTMQLFEGLSTFSLRFVLKIFLASLITALVLGILNYFFKVGFTEKKSNN